MHSPARLAQWLLIAFLSSGTARASPPESLDFPARAAVLEVAGDPSSLVEAASLRRALGQPELAVADTERFFERLAADPQSAVAAANAYLDELADPALAPEPAVREASLRRFLSLVSAAAPSSALLAARTRAEVLLAAQLWDQSCPLPAEQRSDSACIERIDLRGGSYDLSLRKRWLARQRGLAPESEIDPCYEPPPFRYVVHARRPGPAREAQTLLAGALGRARPKDALSFQRTDVLAQARFLVAEPRFEAALAHSAPGGLDFDPNHPRRRRNAEARFSAWLRIRAEGPRLFPREQRLYEAAELGASAAWSLAAQARLAQLFLDLDTQLFHTPQVIRPPPPPRGISKTEWRTIFRDPICCLPPDSLWLEEAQKSLKVCIETAARLTLYTPFVRSCREILSGLDHYEFGKGDEILPLPNAQTVLLVRSEPGGTAR
jgi:hypothetical protein